MMISERDRSLALSSRKSSAHLTPGPKVNPDSPAQVAKRLGLKPSTYRNRLRRVAEGHITLLEAQTKTVMSRQEYSRLGAAVIHQKS